MIFFSERLNKKSKSKELICAFDVVGNIAMNTIY
jgi:hypothetical protein